MIVVPERCYSLFVMKVRSRAISSIATQTNYTAGQDSLSRLLLESRKMAVVVSNLSALMLGLHDNVVTIGVVPACVIDLAALGSKHLGSYRCAVVDSGVIACGPRAAPTELTGDIV